MSSPLFFDWVASVPSLSGTRIVREVAVPGLDSWCRGEHWRSSAVAICCRMQVLRFEGYVNGRVAGPWIIGFLIEEILSNRSLPTSKLNWDI